MYVWEANEAAAAPQQAIPPTNCQVTAPSRAEGTEVQSDVSHHPDHQPKQCPAPPLRKTTLSMAATILLAVSVCLVCGAMCVATAFAAEPVGERDEPSTPAPSHKAVRHGSVVAQRWVSWRPKWHQWWSCFAASVKASRRAAGTVASYCAATGAAASIALGHVLCAAASSVPAVTAAGMARFQKVCSAAKQWYIAVTSCCSQCWVTIAAATAWLHLHGQPVCCYCSRSTTAASRAAWRWVSSSAAPTVATISMAASRRSWSCVKLCWSSLVRRYKASEQMRRQSWSLAKSSFFALCCVLASSTCTASQACCRCLSAAA